MSLTLTSNDAVALPCDMYMSHVLLASPGRMH